MTLPRAADLLPLAAQSILQPRVVLRRVLSWEIARQDLYKIAALLVVLNMMTSLLAEILLPKIDGIATTSAQPFAMVVILALTIASGALLLFFFGRAAGGTGNFDDCLKTVLWLNFVYLIIQQAMPFAAAASPEIFGLVFMLVALVAIIQITASVMELHGFTNILLTVLGILGAQFIFLFVVVLVFAILGVTPPLE